MSEKKTFLKTTLGKKIIMAITGLLLVGFLTSHLAGNFLLFDAIGGREAFNNYAHWLIKHPLIIPMEIGLFALFLIHIVTAFKVTMVNKSARPQKYEVNDNLGKSTFASRTMLQTGSIIFIFLILHLNTFKFGEEYYGDKAAAETTEIATADKAVEKIDAAIVDSKSAVVKDNGPRDLYKTVKINFAKKWYSIIYILCMIGMGIHLCHGIQSAFQTLGLNHPKYNCCVKRFSCILAIIFAVGYSIFPIYFGFIK